MKKIKSWLFLSPLLVGLSAQAASSYNFPNNLPPGCSRVSSGNYSCGVLTFTTGDTVTIASAPATVSFTGALTVGDGIFISSGGSPADLKFVVNGALTLGAGSVINANVVGIAAVTTGVGSSIGGNLIATTTNGVITLGANSAIGGYISTDAGAITIGHGSTVGGSVSASTAGVITLTTGIKVGGNVSSDAGAITIGDGTTICGNIAITGAGVVTLTENIKVGGNVSSVPGAITIGAGSWVNGDVTITGAGVVTLTSTQVGGNVTTVAGAITLTGSRVGGTVLASGAGVITLTTSLAKDSTLSIPPACTPVPPPIVSGAASRFECLETELLAGAAWIAETTTANTKHRLYTKLVGTPFAFDVVALKVDGTVELNYVSSSGAAKSATVELVDASSSLACADKPSLFMGSATFAAGNTSGRTTSGSFSVLNAYASLRCRVTDASAVKTCSTDSFAIRPAVFTITSTNATNSATSGTLVFKAGSDNFNLTATAVTGYDRIPSVDATKVVGSSVAGTLSGSFGAASIGAALGNFTYSEVGNFGLNADAVYDTSFTSIDQGSDCVVSSTSNTLSGGKYGCWVGSSAVAQATGSSGFGRFIPDHFNIKVLLSDAVPMPCPTGLTCPVSYNGFVYAGQPFSVQVTAKNASDATTVNYNTTTGFAKDTTLSAFGALGTTTAPTGAGNLGVTSVTAFVAGTLTETAEKYTFSTIPTAPTAIYIRASDGEASSLRASKPTTIPVEGGVLVVSGRMNIPNVYGSELLTLPMTVTVQYYNGTRWVTSATDSVTKFNTNPSTAGGNLVATIMAGPLALSNISVVGAGAVTVEDGIGIFTLNKPGVSGSAGVSLNAPTYLPTVTGRATFGIYKSPLIYRRENY